MTVPQAAPVGRRVPRMTLGSIVTKSEPQPLRLLIHGIEKGGKTTLAAGAPSPIFICPEDGLPPELARTPHFPMPADGRWTGLDVVDALRALAQGGHDFKTVVLDTADWIEPLLWADLCEQNDWQSIETPGYGKGYVAATDRWRSIVSELEVLRRKGMNIIILAHSAVRTFKDPESEGWDRWELKLHKGAAGLLKEWVEAVLFLKHDIVAVKDDPTKKKGRARGVSTGARILHTTYAGAFDAGNRYSLPAEIKIPETGGWEILQAAIDAGPGKRVAMLTASINAKIATMAKPKDAEDATGALGRAGDDASKLLTLDAWCTSREKTAPVAEKGV